MRRRELLVLLGSAMTAARPVFAQMAASRHALVQAELRRRLRSPVTRERAICGCPSWSKR